jgi:hypothetical protein
MGTFDRAMSVEMVMHLMLSVPRRIVRQALVAKGNISDGPNIFCHG